LLVTFLTPPTDEAVLLSFYKKIHPGGFLWKKIYSKLPGVKNDSNFLRMFINWLFGVLLVYSILFGIGKLIFGYYLEFVLYLLAAIVSISMRHPKCNSLVGTIHLTGLCVPKKEA